MTQHSGSQNKTERKDGREEIGREEGGWQESEKEGGITKICLKLQKHLLKKIL